MRYVTEIEGALMRYQFEEAKVILRTLAGLLPDKLVELIGLEIWKQELEYSALVKQNQSPGKEEVKKRFEALFK